MFLLFLVMVTAEVHIPPWTTPPPPDDAPAWTTLPVCYTYVKKRIDISWTLSMKVTFHRESTTVRLLWMAVFRIIVVCKFVNIFPSDIFRVWFSYLKIAPLYGTLCPICRCFGPYFWGYQATRLTDLYLPNKIIASTFESK